jgi:hypothetical protein
MIERNRSVLQDWVHRLPFMQQSVLISAVRGPDGVSKYASIKYLLRWYRRCILLDAMTGTPLPKPHTEGGGSFTGKSFDFEEEEIEDWEPQMYEIFSRVLKEVDSFPHHFWLHFIHAVEIIGYQHPNLKVRCFWHNIYSMCVEDMHMHLETIEEMESRLGDTREGWLARSHPATTE